MAVQPVNRNEALAGWEVRLLELATRGQQTDRTGPPDRRWSVSPIRSERSRAGRLHATVRADAYADAYDVCEAITRRNSATFTWASQLLPLPQRRAVRALYAFCRITDDIVDEGNGGLDSARKLRAWRRACLGARSDTPVRLSAAPLDASQIDHPVALAWADARERFQVPDVYSHQLIDGVARDLNPVAYDTFDELSAYCYGVASTVGLMAMHIVGYQGPEATAYAVRLGVALQMTNILRDVGEDVRHGRLYLPREELSAFGLTPDDVASGRLDKRWRQFMAFQIRRNRQLYVDSLPGVGLLAPAGRFAIGAAAELYAGILDDIEAHGADVYSRRARLSTGKKLRRLPGIWWRSRVCGYGRSKLAVGATLRPLGSPNHTEPNHKESPS